MLQFLLLGLISFSVQAEVFKYEGIATIKGKTVYTEKHEYTTNEKGEVVESKTLYLGVNGETVGDLKNDYRPSLSLPEHRMEDNRRKNYHGVRYIDGKIQLFNQNKNEKEETEFIENNPKKGLMVASQGLHYYVVSNFEKMKVKDFTLQFLIPGRLDSYRFVWNYLGKDKDGLEEFEVKIDNWILRMFAPSLLMKYHPETKRLIYYKGLSNIEDDKGEMMNVEINYKY